MGDTRQATELLGPIREYDMTEVNNMFGQIEDFLAKSTPHVETHEPQQTSMQTDYFVIGNGGHGHPWGMYIQAMRELSVRHQSVIQLRRQLQRDKLDIVEASTIPEGLSIIETQRRGLEIEEALEKKHQNETRLKALLAESERVIGHVEILSEKLGPLTPEKRDEYERDYWVHKIKLRIGFCAMTHASLPEEILIALTMFPKAMRDELLVYIHDPKKALSDFYDSVGQTEPLQLPEATCP